MTKEKQVKWQYTEERHQFNKTIVYRALRTRSEIIVQGEIKDSNPKLWIEVSVPKVFGFRWAVDKCAVESLERDFKI